MTGEIFIHKEAHVFHKAVRAVNVRLLPVLLLDGHTVAVLDGIADRIKLHVLGKQNGLGHVEIHSGIGSVRIAGANDRYLDPLRAHILPEGDLQIVLVYRLSSRQLKGILKTHTEGIFQHLGIHVMHTGLVDPMGVRQNGHSSRLLDLVVDPLAVAIFQRIDVFGSLGLLCLGKKLGMNALLIPMVEIVDTVSASEIHNMDPSAEMDLLPSEHFESAGHSLVCLDHAVRGIVRVVIGQSEEIIALLTVIGGNDQGILIAVRARGVRVKISSVGISFVKVGQKRVDTEFQRRLLFFLTLLVRYRDHPFLLLAEGIGHRKASVLGIDAQTVKRNRLLQDRGLRIRLHGHDTDQILGSVIKAQSLSHGTDRYGGRLTRGNGARGDTIFGQRNFLVTVHGLSPFKNAYGFIIAYFF